MLIKVCGLREGENVEQLLRKGVPDMLGMIFYEKSPRFVEAGASKPMKSSYPAISKVGVFVNASIEKIKEAKEKYPFEIVQLHGDESSQFVAALKEDLAIKVIKVFQVSDKIDLEKMIPFEGLVDFFLFDTQTSAYGGSGKKFDWRALESYSLKTPYLLSGGIDLEHVEEIISFSKSNPKMVGVDINSKFELNPGLKDPEKAGRFINLIREKTINQIDYDRNR